jgi:hypothetical protein
MESGVRIGGPPIRRVGYTLQCNFGDGLEKRGNRKIATEQNRTEQNRSQQNRGRAPVGQELEKPACDEWGSGKGKKKRKKAKKEEGHKESGSVLIGGALGPNPIFNVCVC